MKSMKIIAFLVLGFVNLSAIAATTPDPVPKYSLAKFYRGQLKVKDVEMLTDRKMHLLERIQFKILQFKLSKKINANDDELTEKQKKQANLSFILGLSSIVLIFIPVIGVLALPAAILAIIFGSKSLKGNSNTKGIIGIVAGGVMILLFLVAIALLAVFLSGGWG